MGKTKLEISHNQISLYWKIYYLNWIWKIFSFRCGIKSTTSLMSPSKSPDSEVIKSQKPSQPYIHKSFISLVNHKTIVPTRMSLYDTPNHVFGSYQQWTGGHKITPSHLLSLTSDGRIERQTSIHVFPFIHCWCSLIEIYYHRHCSSSARVYLIRFLTHLWLVLSCHPRVIIWLPF